MNLHDRGWVHEHQQVSVPIRVTDRITFRNPQSSPPYAVEYADGSFDICGSGEPRFKISVASRAEFVRLISLDPYSLAIDEAHKEMMIAAAGGNRKKRPTRGVMNAIVTFSWPEIF